MDSSDVRQFLAMRKNGEVFGRLDSDISRVRILARFVLIQTN